MNTLIVSAPFPLEWVDSNPRAVEEALGKLSIEEQARLVDSLSGKQQRDLLTLSPQAVQVLHALPSESVYYMIKDWGEEDALILMEHVSPEQMQYVFDIEWWRGDRFRPDQALHWLRLIDGLETSPLLEWFKSEDFDEKVMLLQALIKVYKRDELTDTPENVEGLEHFSPDGVYDIFFKVEEPAAIRRLLAALRAEDENLFFSLMEAVIWYPLTPTVENAYRWHAVRLAEHGIPEFDEAFTIYSNLDAGWLKDESLAPEAEAGEMPGPGYVLKQIDPGSFFSRALNLVSGDERRHALRWEILALANKVLVADRMDATDFGQRKKAMEKVGGYVNIGLELGSSGDAGRGRRLLERTWARFLFQAGYTRLKELRWKAQKFIRDHAALLDGLIPEGDKEQLGRLLLRFPQIAGEESETWRDFTSLDDVLRMERFLERGAFFSRFARQALGLTPETLESFLAQCAVPTRDDADLLVWTTTALARFTMFREVSSVPLIEAAAKNFLQVIFVQPIHAGDAKVCHEEMIQAFHQKLLESPMAWTDDDRVFLTELLAQTVENLERQYGRLDLKRPVDWRYTHGLAVIT